MKYLAMVFFATCTISMPLMGENQTDQSVRIVAVDRSAEPETVATIIQLPRSGDVLSGHPIWVQIRLNGYTLGSQSSFDRAEEIANSDLGQTLHVIIDDHPYFAVNGPSMQPFNEGGFYYNQSYKFEIPFQLKEGVHTLRVFPARSFGESLKGQRTYQASYFVIEQNSDDSQVEMFSRPYLTYNEPSDRLHLLEKKPILLDFYVLNCELSSDGYKVRLTIDGKIQRTFISWQPYYIYGLKKGKHTIRLELIDKNNKTIPGLYNDVQRIITVH